MSNKKFYFRSVDRIAKQYDELVSSGEFITYCAHVAMLYGVSIFDVANDAKIFSLKWLGANNA